MWLGLVKAGVDASCDKKHKSSLCLWDGFLGILCFFLSTYQINSVEL